MLLANIQKKTKKQIYFLITMLKSLNDLWGALMDTLDCILVH